MNTGSAMSVTHCQQQPFYPHRHFHFVMCSAVDAFLLHPQIKSVLTLEGLIPGREIPKHLVLEGEFAFRLWRKACCSWCAPVRRWGWWKDTMRGESGVHMILQPVGLWKACSISTLDNNKAKYSLRKKLYASSWKGKVCGELSAFFFSSCLWYLITCLTDFGADTLSHLVPPLLLWCLFSI